MERVLKQVPADGHEVTVIEIAEDDGSSFVLVVDGVIVNDGEPFAAMPTDAEVRDVFRRWRR